MISKETYNSNNVLVILGPTASGKTALAVKLADQLDGEVVSADSRQVYRGLTIGTGKDLETYQLPNKRIPYHLIDIADLEQEYSVFHFQQHCFIKIEELWQRKKLPIVVGGSGLYLESILKSKKIVAVPENKELRTKIDKWSDDQLRHYLLDLKPQQHNQTDLIDRFRTIRAIEIALYEKSHQAQDAPPIKAYLMGLQWERPVLRQRIKQRLHARLKTGLLDEVTTLMQQGISCQRLNQLGLEYRYCLAYLQGEFANYQEFVDKLYLAICDFAKRQLAWFRRMERKGHIIHWINDSDLLQAQQYLSKVCFNQYG